MGCAVTKPQAGSKYIRKEQQQQIKKQNQKQQHDISINLKTIEVDERNLNKMKNNPHEAHIQNIKNNLKVDRSHLSASMNSTPTKRESNRQSKIYLEYLQHERKRQKTIQQSQRQSSGFIPRGVPIQRKSVLQNRNERAVSGNLFRKYGNTEYNKNNKSVTHENNAQDETKDYSTSVRDPEDNYKRNIEVNDSEINFWPSRSYFSTEAGETSPIKSIRTIQNSLNNSKNKRKDSNQQSQQQQSQIPTDKVFVDKETEPLQNFIRTRKSSALKQSSLIKKELGLKKILNNKMGGPQINLGSPEQKSILSSGVNQTNSSMRKSELIQLQQNNTNSFTLRKSSKEKSSERKSLDLTLGSQELNFAQLTKGNAGSRQRINSGLNSSYFNNVSSIQSPFVQPSVFSVQVNF